MEYIIYLLILALLLSTAWAGLSFAPWIPAKKEDLNRIMQFAHIQPGEYFFDLGCGDGRTVVAAARQGARAIGYEISIPLLFVCFVRKWLNPGLAIGFFPKSLFAADLSRADIVYVFGTPDKLKTKLQAKLEKELRPGARVISYVFKFEDWTPVAVSKPEPDDISIYFYSIPTKQLINKTVI